MNSDLTNAMAATSKDAQYDASAKRLLGQKSILAHVLEKTVEEFKGMNPFDIIPLIEGDPFINTVPVEPGLTNAVFKNNGQRIIGFNSENQELYEGLARFDIIFK